MPFVIDQGLCVGCGSCIGNCPNRAIVRRGAEVVITEMCCDCGACKRFCGVSAINKGTIKAEFNNKKLDRELKKQLSLNRNIVALKFADNTPTGVAVEDGLNFWCHICGDIFAGSTESVFFTAKNSVCGGSANLGLGMRKLDRDTVPAVMEAVTGDGGYFTCGEFFTKPRSLYPSFPRVYSGLIIGPLQQIKVPDIVLLPVNGKQMSMLSTAYSFETGELIAGTAGGGTCLGTVTIPFLENRPAFTCGDYGGRMHMRLKDEESLVSFPYRLVPGTVKNLGRTVFAQE